MELLTELRAGITSRNYGPELRLWNYDVTSHNDKVKLKQDQAIFYVECL